MSGTHLGNGSNGSSSASSRRGKKSGSQSSDKPKQPQRGLGVAQLEKIRLHSQIEEMKMQAYAAMQSSMGGAQSSQFSYSSSQYGYPNNHNIIMGMGDLERSQQRFSESQTYNQLRWNPSHVFQGSQPYGPPEMATRHFLNSMEDSGKALRNGWFDKMAGSSSLNSGDSQDLDLELKL